MTLLQPQQGIALITVLLVLAVASVAVVSMSSARQADIRRTDNQLLAEQRWALALALEQQAVAVLKRDNPDEVWRRQELQFQAVGQSAHARIEALQGRFNLNNLLRDGEVSSEDLSRLRRLLAILKLEPKLADAIVDWMDADSEARYPDGAEDEHYTRYQPPYRAANRPFATVGELLLVAGVNREIYQILQPYIYVADDYAPLNINIASATLLRCLADDISADQAESIFRAAGKPFNNIDDFLKDEAVSNLSIAKYGLGVSNQHFLMTGDIDSDRNRFRFISQLRRDHGDVEVVGRRRLGAADG